MAGEPPGGRESGAERSLQCGRPGAEAEIDSQGRILFSTDLRRELGIENQPVRLYAYRTRIEVLSDKIYQERRGEASANPVEDANKLDEAGLP